MNQRRGALSLAGRENLDNLVWVVNCNLQRLDGPVRGNGKIIQELESIFRGAGWNVIKVVWGSDWDPLLAADRDGLLRRPDALTALMVQNGIAFTNAWAMPECSPSRAAFFSGRYPERTGVVSAACTVRPRRS
jgi:pyruvate dehydrogenase E1 component